MGLDVFPDGGRVVLVHLQRLTVLLLGLFASTSAYADWTYFDAKSFTPEVDENGNECSNPFPASERYQWADDRMASYFRCSGDFECKREDEVRSCNTSRVALYYRLKPEEPEPVDPSECFETGGMYDSISKQCVPECAGMVLDGFCLQPYEDESEEGCTPDTPGFVGSYLHGNKKTNVCAPAQQECTDSGGTFGIVNGEQTCLPEGYGAPQCKSDSISEVLVNDGYGFFCESPNQPEPEEEEPEPEPNVDTDGDGQPDEYDRTQDPDAGNKQRDEMIGEQKKANDALGDLADRLDGVKNVGKKGNEMLDDIEDGIGGINSKLDDLNDAPEGGFDTSGLTSVVPTMAESSAELVATFQNSNVGQALGDLVAIPQSTSCPVYQIPSTDYTPAYALDIHCQVFEDYRGILSALFLFFWTGTALFVFFKA